MANVSEHTCTHVTTSILHNNDQFTSTQVSKYVDGQLIIAFDITRISGTCNHSVN